MLGFRVFGFVGSQGLGIQDLGVEYCVDFQLDYSPFQYQ